MLRRCFSDVDAKLAACHVSESPQTKRTSTQMRWRSEYWFEISAARKTDVAILSEEENARLLWPATVNSPDTIPRPPYFRRRNSMREVPLVRYDVSRSLSTFVA